MYHQINKSLTVVVFQAFTVFGSNLNYYYHIHAMQVIASQNGLTPVEVRIKALECIERISMSRHNFQGYATRTVKPSGIIIGSTAMEV